MRDGDPVGMARGEVAQGGARAVVGVPVKPARGRVAGIKERVVHVGEVDPSFMEVRLGVELLYALVGQQVARGTRRGGRVADIAQQGPRLAEVAAGGAEAIERGIGDVVHAANVDLAVPAGTSAGPGLLRDRAAGHVGERPRPDAGMDAGLALRDRSRDFLGDGRRDDP